MQISKLSKLCVSLLLLAACGGDDSSQDDDVLCETAESGAGMVRCRDTTMIERSRAYRLPDGRLMVFLERGPAEQPSDYVKLELSATAEQKAPSIWNLSGDPSMLASFVQLKGRDEPQRQLSPYKTFDARQGEGTLTISKYISGASPLEGVIRDGYFEDNLYKTGVAKVPTMRFSIGCVGQPSTDDPACADMCGSCKVTDACGNVVTLKLTPCR